MKSALWAFLVLLGCSEAVPGQGARILLTPARLHRLQRDRERNTPRWSNFEQRVKTTPESPERGFELALYAIVAGDEARGREAVDWALTHPCERRQVALILNWTRERATNEQRKRLSLHSCPAATSAGPYSGLRDRFFWAVAMGEDDDFKAPVLQLADLPEAAELYALIEFLDAYRTRQDRDLRRAYAAYFGRLPELFLLASPPGTLDHPSRQAHLAALALVSLDPNLEASQFLQSWAMEMRFQLSDGPEVGYELLWADPYLPGLGYQNLQPWLYLDNDASLWARSDWSAGACWIHIAPGREESRNCAAGWNKAPAQFGHLTLRPMDKGCFEMPQPKPDQHDMLRTAKPQERLVATKFRPPHLVSSDAAGLRLLTQDDYAGICIESKGRGH